MGDPFTHLHVHTEFSMLDGAARLDELVAKAVADGQPAIGITDHGNMYGILEFYKECRKQGIKPVIGTEAYMAHDHRSERPARRGRQDDSGGDTEGGNKLYYHLTLLAETDEGYRNLIQLSSKAFLEGYYYKPRLDWELLERHASGVIATTGCLGGHVLQIAAAAATPPVPPTKAARLQEIFGRDNLFVELQDHGLAEQRRTNPQLIELARHIGAPLLATNDSHYTHREDHEAHDALLCVQTAVDALGPQALQVRGPGALPEVGRRDALAVPRGARGLRQHAVDRRAGRRHHRVRQGAAARLPDARGLRRRSTSTCANSRWTGPRARWGSELAADVVQRLQFELVDDRDDGLQRLLPDRVGPDRPRPRSRGSASAPGVARPPAVRWPTACASPTSTRSATTCCSSASSTRVAGVDARHRHGLRLPLAETR